MGERSNKIQLIQFIIPLVGSRGGDIPFSLNKLKGVSPYVMRKTGRNIPPWANYKRAKTHYQKFIEPAYSLNLHPPREDFKRYVLISRLFPSPKRLMDRDNMIGGCKPLMDVLSAEGYIYDDKPKNVFVKYNQIKVEKGRVHSLRITVWMNEDEKFPNIGDW